MGLSNFIISSSFPVKIVYVSLTSTSGLCCDVVLSDFFPHLAPTVCFFALWPVSCYVHCRDAVSTEVFVENEMK